MVKKIKKIENLTEKSLIEKTDIILLEKDEDTTKKSKKEAK
jgi:hypothetical protein